LCDFLGPKKPATRSTVEELEKEEQKIGLGQLVGNAVEKIKLAELKGL
jgi:hypothetical protein